MPEKQALQCRYTHTNVHRKHNAVVVSMRTLRLPLAIAAMNEREDKTGAQILKRIRKL